MKVLQIIRLESGDGVNERQPHDALNLVGGADQLSENAQAAFRRIRGNDFTVEDVATAVAAVTAHRDKVVRLADRVGRNPGFPAEGADAIRANAREAVTLMENFQREILAELAEHQVEREPEGPTL